MLPPTEEVKRDLKELFVFPVSESKRKLLNS
jgi:hypothetical protein